MPDGFWSTTRSGLFRSGESWQEVALYAQPLDRFLASRYPHINAPDRADLVQEILLEMKEKLVVRYQRSRGPFRALLQVLIKRRVIDALRRQRRSPSSESELELLADPSPQEVQALDLEVGLLEAVEGCRKHFMNEEAADVEVLYALADRLLKGLSNLEIARRNKLSPDQVARLLRKGRDEILAQLLMRELGLTRADARLKAAVSALRSSIRSPRSRSEALGQVTDPELSNQLGEFFERFQSSLSIFSGNASCAGQELQRSLSLILQLPKD